MQVSWKIRARDFLFGGQRRAYAKVSKHCPKLTFLPKMPHVICIELTNDCNMACPHCARQRFMHRDIGYMDFELFKKIVDEISACQWCFLRIGGLGEPALHPYLPQMMDYIMHRPFKVELVTNGTLVRTFSPQTILNWHIDLLDISIDGHDEASYARCRPGGDYIDLRRKVIELYAAKSVAKSRFPEIHIRNILFSTTTHEQVLEFKQRWLPFADVVRFNVLMTGCEREPRVLKVCHHIEFSTHVQWDGRVPLCEHQIWYSNMEWVGNLQQNSLAELWRHPRLNDLRAAHHNGDLRDYAFCRRCFCSQQDHLKLRVTYDQHRNPVVSRWRQLLRLVGG